MRKFVLLVLVVVVGLSSASTTTPTSEKKLREWRRGVWLLADGSYAVYTDNHYFVVSVSGDSARSNIYCGGSQIRFTPRGIARRQSLRIRKLPGGDLKLFKHSPVTKDHGEPDLKIDMTQFQPGTCNVADNVIYDSLTEETDAYILLSTCNGDKEKIFSDGRSVYLPAGGGEFWAYRVESW